MNKTITGSRPVPEGYTELKGSAPFTVSNGPFYEKVIDGQTVIRGFRVEARHLNSLKLMHGGMMMTFADSALARTVIHGTGRRCVTIKMSSEFLSPAREGDWVEAHAEVIRSTRTIAFVRGDFRVGSKTIFKADGLFQYVNARK
ncbi:MAG: PaaI family thioesterase [Alphaproteobacteria bacterium]|nr:MAG: PaaI family thioesterase [Alphaproteobacteria bacterium]